MQYAQSTPVNRVQKLGVGTLFQWPPPGAPPRQRSPPPPWTSPGAPPRPARGSGGASRRSISHSRPRRAHAARIEGRRRACPWPWPRITARLSPTRLSCVFGLRRGGSPDVWPLANSIQEGSVIARLRLRSVSS